MPLKVVRVYLPKELYSVLERMIEELGISESEILRQAFIEYARNYKPLQVLPTAQTERVPVGGRLTKLFKV